MLLLFLLTQDLRVLCCLDVKNNKEGNKSKEKIHNTNNKSRLEAFNI